MNVLAFRLKFSLPFLTGRFELRHGCKCQMHLTSQHQDPKQVLKIGNAVHGEVAGRHMSLRGADRMICSTSSSLCAQPQATV